MYVLVRDSNYRSVGVVIDLASLLHLHLLTLKIHKFTLLCTVDQCVHK